MSDAHEPAHSDDLDSPEQIGEMVRRFYAKVTADDLLGPMFNEVAQVDWELHLPKLTAFWCRALLGHVGYRGNPFRAHALVHVRCRVHDGPLRALARLVPPHARSGMDRAERPTCTRSGRERGAGPQPPADRTERCRSDPSHRPERVGGQRIPQWRSVTKALTLATLRSWCVRTGGAGQPPHPPRARRRRGPLRRAPTPSGLVERSAPC